MAWSKGSAPLSLPLASGDSAENAQDTDNYLQRIPTFQSLVNLNVLGGQEEVGGEQKPAA